MPGILVAAVSPWIRLTPQEKQTVAFSVRVNSFVSRMDRHVLGRAAKAKNWLEAGEVSLKRPFLIRPGL